MGGAGILGAILVMDSNRVTSVLKLFGILEWSRISVGIHPVDGLYQPPMVIWRYISPDDQTRAIFAQAIDSFAGELEWAGGFTRKNWSMMPERLRIAFEERDPNAEVGAMASIKDADQGFCEAANLDLERLLINLEDMWRNGVRRSR